MQIRKIQIADARAFLELRNSVDESGFMLYAPGERKTTPDEQEQMLRKLLATENAVIFVAEENGELLGFAGAMGSTFVRERHSADVFAGVLEKARGKGIGTALFNELLSWAERSGITRLGLTVITSNVRAIALYKKMGFSIEGERVQSLIIDGEPVNEYYMYKLLPNEKGRKS